MGSCTDRLVAVYPPRAENTERRLLTFHYPGMDTAGMRPQKPVRLLINIKSVLHIPGRMIFRKIQRGKIMPVIFNFRTFRHRETQSPENMNDLVTYQGNRMMGAQG